MYIPISEDLAQAMCIASLIFFVLFLLYMNKQVKDHRDNMNK